ncbi:MAG: NUDIX hydrolase [Actinobacteria bacterium]|nr:NUDIX hydrolase [Actinomycetota bacterium]
MSEPRAARTLFEGKTLAVRVEEWEEGAFEIVARTNAVVVVPRETDGSVVLVRQFRPATRKHLLELPAGKLDAGEEPEAAARRELEEETGLRGGTWERGPSLWATPGFCEERMHLFFAEDLERGDASPQDGEEIELARWRSDEIADRLAEIEDAKTLAGLLLLLRRDRARAPR